MALKRGVIAAIVVVIVVIATIGAVLALQSPQGTVSVYVKDPPAEWSHVNITFSTVEIHPASSTDNNSGWITLKIVNGTIDLVRLTNASSILASSNVATGKYTQIRIVVSSATGVMTNGTNVTFKVPSGELRTTHPFNVTSGQTSKLTLGFSLQQSIIETGQGWTFKPVLGEVLDS